MCEKNIFWWKQFSGINLIFLITSTTCKNNESKMLNIHGIIVPKCLSTIPRPFQCKFYGLVFMTFQCCLTRQLTNTKNRNKKTYLFYQNNRGGGFCLMDQQPCDEGHPHAQGNRFSTRMIFCMTDLKITRGTCIKIHMMK